MALVRRFIHNQGRIVLKPVIRKVEEFFSKTVEDFARAQKPSLIVNANFYDLSDAGKVDAFMGSDPVAPAETTPLGHVVERGQRVVGTSAAQDFYIAFNEALSVDKADLTRAFSTGQGNPPAQSAAFGGLGPIIIGGLPYGNTNEYAAGVPAGAPRVGEPPAAARPFLRRRSSAKYAAFAARDSSTGGTLGKTCVGVSPRELMIFVQEDGTPGESLDAIRDEFLAAGCQHAVFFDGSDSAMMYARTDGFLVRQGPNKDETCTVGVAFFWYPPEQKS